MCFVYYTFPKMQHGIELSSAVMPLHYLLEEEAQHGEGINLFGGGLSTREFGSGIGVLILRAEDDRGPSGGSIG